MDRAASTKFCILGAVVVAILAGAVGMAMWAHRRGVLADEDLRQLLDSARSRGFPTSMADFEPNPPVKPQDNAAPFIWEAMRLEHRDKATVSALKGLRSRRQTRSGPPTPTESRQAAQLGTLCDLALQAADKRRCDFGYDYDIGPDLYCPELAQLKSLTEALCCRAAVELAGGMKTEALRDLKGAIRLGRHATASRTVVGLLSALTCDRIAIDACEQAAAAYRDDSVFLDALGRTLDWIQPLPDARVAMRGQEYLALAYLRNFDIRGRLPWIADLDLKRRTEGGALPDTKLVVRDGLPRNGTARELLSRALSYWVHLQTDIGSSVNYAGIRNVALRLSAEPKWRAGLVGPFADLLCPDYARVCTSCLNLKALYMCERDLMPLLSYRVRKGVYPRRLADIGLTSDDPFTGKPLRYVVIRDGCKVYSVGPDGKDNGGVDKRDLANNHKGDEGWDVVASFPAHFTKKR